MRTCGGLNKTVNEQPHSHLWSSACSRCRTHNLFNHTWNKPLCGAPFPPGQDSRACDSTSKNTRPIHATSGSVSLEVLVSKRKMNASSRDTKRPPPWPPRHLVPVNNRHGAIDRLPSDWGGQGDNITRRSLADASGHSPSPPCGPWRSGAGSPAPPPPGYLQPGSGSLLEQSPRNPGHTLCRLSLRSALHPSPPTKKLRRSAPVLASPR